jgi:peptidoglycan biosynthesis protein MviN/MurJ (putative lipid II flippase)
MSNNKRKQKKNNTEDEISLGLRIFIIIMCITMLFCYLFSDKIAPGYDWYPGRWFDDMKKWQDR